MAAQASRMAGGGWVVRIAVEVLDELLSVVAGSSGCLKDKRDLVGHEAWAGAGCRDEPCVGRKCRDQCRVDKVRAAS